MAEDNTLHLVVINELYDYQSIEFGIRFKEAILSLDGRSDVLIVAASKLSSADIITSIIERSFHYRITSLQPSDMNIEIFFGEDDATYIEKVKYS